MSGAITDQAIDDYMAQHNCDWHQAYYALLQSRSFFHPHFANRERDQ